jgi:ubiquinone/menaquinone biosynthesis C-methylase UbiE
MDGFQMLPSLSWSSLISVVAPLSAAVKDAIRLDPVDDWVELGEKDPYFGVLSSEENKGQQLDAETLNAFYRSGQAHVDVILKIAKRQFSFEPHGKALDFGCGVGRVTCALAPHFSEVVGLDISDGMLAKAKAHSNEFGHRNIRYLNTSAGYDIPENDFDFVHSYIVLQHMDIPLGEKAFRQMVRGLRSNGFAAIHFTHGHVKGRSYHSLREILKKTAVTRAVGNLLLGRKWNNTAVLMSGYSIDRMFAILRESGIENMFVHLVDDWGDLGLFVFFRKGPDAASGWSNPVRS